jgi:hypothetical protein
MPQPRPAASDAEAAASEIVGGETLRFRLSERTGSVVFMPLPCAQPTARHPAARTVTHPTSQVVRWFIAGPP